MKVLADVNVGGEFRERLANALGSPNAVSHAVAEGWGDLENGDLQKEAKAAGFTHLVTYDKSMADKHVPRIHAGHASASGVFLHHVPTLRATLCAYVMAHYKEGAI